MVVLREAHETHDSKGRPFCEAEVPSQEGTTERRMSGQSADVLEMGEGTSLDYP